MDPSLPSSVPSVIARVLGIAETLVSAASETWSKLLDSKTFSIADALAADFLYKVQCTRRIRFIAEISAELQRRSVPARALPEGFALQAIEGGAAADDEDVRRLWRNLICSAVADPSMAHPFVIESLRRMSGADARVLHAVATGTVSPRSLPGHPFIELRTVDPPDQVQAALERLVAIGLIRSTASFGWLRDSNGNLGVGITEVGGQFLAAVGAPDEPNR